jgi:superfamily II DNA/RNA helicase
MRQWPPPATRCRALVRTRAIFRLTSYADTSLEQGHDDVHLAFGYDPYLILGDSLVAYLLSDPSCGGISPGGSLPQTLPFLYAAEALLSRLVARIGSLRVVFFDALEDQWVPQARLLRSLLKTQLRRSSAVYVECIDSIDTLWSEEYNTLVRGSRPAFVVTLGLEDALALSPQLYTEKVSLVLGSALLRAVTRDRIGAALLRGNAFSTGSEGRISLADGKFRAFYIDPVRLAPFFTSCDVHSPAMTSIRSVIALSPPTPSVPSTEYEAVKAVCAKAVAASHADVSKLLDTVAAAHSLSKDDLVAATSGSLEQAVRAICTSIASVGTALASSWPALASSPFASTIARATLISACVQRSLPLQDRAMPKEAMDSVLSGLECGPHLDPFFAQLSTHLQTAVHDAVSSTGSVSASPFSMDSLLSMSRSESWTDVLDGRCVAAVIAFLADGFVSTSSHSSSAAELLKHLMAADGLASASDVVDTAVARFPPETAKARLHTVASALNPLVARHMAVAASAAAWDWLVSKCGSAVAPAAPWTGLTCSAGPAWRTLTTAAKESAPTKPSLPKPEGDFATGVLTNRMSEVDAFVSASESATDLFFDRHGLLSDEAMEPLADEIHDPLRHLLREDDPFAVEHFSMEDSLVRLSLEADTAADAASAVRAQTVHKKEPSSKAAAPTKTIKIPRYVPMWQLTDEQRREKKRLDALKIKASSAGGRRAMGMTTSESKSQLMRVSAHRDQRTATHEEILKVERNRRNRTLQKLYASLQAQTESLGFLGIPCKTVVETDDAPVDKKTKSSTTTATGAPTAMFTTQISVSTEWLEGELDKVEKGGKGTVSGRLAAAVDLAKSYIRAEKWASALDALDTVQLPFNHAHEHTLREALVMEAHLPEQVARLRKLLHRRRCLAVRLAGERLRVLAARLRDLAGSLLPGAVRRRRKGSVDEADAMFALDHDQLPPAVREHLMQQAAAESSEGGDVVHDELLRAMGEAYTSAADLLGLHSEDILAQEPEAVGVALTVMIMLGFADAATGKLDTIDTAAVALGAKKGRFHELIPIKEAFLTPVITIRDMDEDAPPAAASAAADAANALSKAAEAAAEAAGISPQRFQLLKAGAELPRPHGEADPRVVFKPDRWQVDLLDAVDSERSCLIVAPTSSGKTFVCYYALEQALRTKKDEDLVIYIAPNEQLVYQCMTDVLARYNKAYDAKAGWGVVGAFTRETRARINQCQLLATTPICAQVLLQAAHSGVLRRRIRWIIFDEVHMLLEDPAWEQSLLSVDCPILALSATVGEPERFASWLASLEQRRGRQLQLTSLSERWNDLETFVYDVNPIRSDIAASSSDASLAEGVPDAAAEDTVAPLHAAATAAGGGDDDDDESVDEEVGGVRPLVSTAAMGALRRLHPIATLLAEDIATHGIPAGADLLPEQAVTLFGALKAAVRGRLSGAIAADSPPTAEAKAALEKLQSELATSMSPEGFGWRGHLNITLREAHTYGRRLLRRLAHVSRLDLHCARAVVASLSAASSAALDRTQVLLSAQDEFALLRANLRGLLITLKRRKMLPALCFRLDRRRCQQLAMSLCLELDQLEYEYRQTPGFVAMQNKVHRMRSAILSKIEAAKARRPKHDPDTPTEEEVELQAELDRLPAVEGVDARFAFLDARSGGPISLEDARKALADKRLREDAFAYDPLHPSVNWRFRALRRGIAFHHAAASRKYRRAVEALFRKRRLSVVFCTSTLALGVNMPCRSVVFVGDSARLHRMAYRQMAGRAGRRGHDNRGNVIFMGLPSTKVFKLVTCSVPRLVGTQVMTSGTAVRLSLQYHAARFKVSGFGELEADEAMRPEGSGTRRGRKGMPMYEGGPEVPIVDEESFRVARASTTATAQRIVECGMIAHHAQNDFGDDGVVAKRDAGQAITGDEPDTDEEDAEEVMGTSDAAKVVSSGRGAFRSVIVDGVSSYSEGKLSVVKDLTAEALKRERDVRIAEASSKAEADSMAKGSKKGAKKGKGGPRAKHVHVAAGEESAPSGVQIKAAPVFDPAVLEAEERSALAAWAHAPRLSARMAFAFIQRHLFETGAISSDGAPRGLAALIADLFHCGPPAQIFAAMVASGHMCSFVERLHEAELDRDERNLALLEVTSCFFAQYPLTVTLQQRSLEDDAFETNKVVLDISRCLTPEMHDFIESWNEATTAGYAQFLRAASIAIHDDLPPASVMPLSGTIAGQVRRGKMVQESVAEIAHIAAAEVADPVPKTEETVAETVAAAPAEDDWMNAGAADDEPVTGDSWMTAAAPAEDAPLEDDWTMLVDKSATGPQDDAPPKDAAVISRVSSGADTVASTGVTSDRPPASLTEAFAASSVAPILRSPCAAIAGYGDKFVSVEDLVLCARPGVRADVAELPVIPSGHNLLNRYAADFFESCSRQALEEENLINDESVFVMIEAFCLHLRRIAISLHKLVEAEAECRFPEGSTGARRLARLRLLATEYHDLALRFWDRYKRYIARDITWIKRYEREL